METSPNGDILKQEEIFTFIATDIRKSDPHQVMTPVSDITFDPRWSRGEEIFGEDPYLISQIGIAASKDLLGDRCFKEKKDVIPTLKHCSGKEVVQGYIRDRVGSVTQPMKKLKGFKKISLKPGETKPTSFTIFLECLAFNNINMQYNAELGDFEIMVENACLDADQTTVTLHVMYKDNII